MKLTTSTFPPGGPIPKTCTCDGGDRSPALAWSEIPVDTRSFALVCDDPDAPRGTWVHWVLYDVPASASGLPEGVRGAPTLDDGSRQGTNDFRRVGYGGPCPPRGATHRYFFRLYALDTVLGLAPGATKATLVKAIEGHTLGQTELMGRYARQ